MLKQVHLIAILLLFMSALLIPRFNDESLWGDEGWSVRFASTDNVTVTMVEDRHPPLYFFMLSAWQDLAGDDEVTLRMLTYFFALLTGVFLYKLGAILFNRQVGLLALLLFALLDKQAYFSLEVRHYIPLIFWTTAASWALVLWLKNPPRKFFYVATVIGGLYTHSFMAPVLLAHAIYVAISAPRRITGLVILYVFAGIAFLPWAFVTLYQYITKGAITPDMPLNWDSVEILAPQYLGTPIALTLGLLLLGLAAPFFKASNWPQKFTVHQIALPFLGIVIPLALVYILTSTVEDIGLLNDRNIAIIMPFVLLMIALGATAFNRFAQGALVVFFIVNGIFTVDIGIHNAPWRPISRYVAQHQINDEPIVVDVGGAEAALYYHMWQENADADLIGLHTLRQTFPQDILTPLYFNELEQARVPGFWYVIWGEDSPVFPALSEWGYVRTDSTVDFHLGSPIYMHRYDHQSRQNFIHTQFGAIALHEMEVSRYQDATVTISFWWSSALPPSEDYVISVRLLDDQNNIMLQQDQVPQAGRNPTSSWEPDQLYYDGHTLRLPEGFAEGTYQISITVYTSEQVIAESVNLGTVEL